MQKTGPRRSISALSTSLAHPRPGKVVILGGGFGGLECARQLGNSGLDVTVIDRRNHNLFQPLLYQVATAALSPADISEPIRRTLGRYPNIRVLLAEVSGVDTEVKAVTLVGGGSLPYDVLVVATGSEYNYFSHPEWQQWTPGLKTVHEARVIRQRLLLAFERAEASDDETHKADLLTTVIIGGGPTGVEMAGAISELGRFMIDRDFKNLSKSHLRIVLVEAGNRILSAFPEDLSTYAQNYMESIGVEVRLNQRVTDVRERGVTINGEHIATGCIIWGAGIKPSPASHWLGVEGREGSGRRAFESDRAVRRLRGGPYCFCSRRQWRAAAGVCPSGKTAGGVFGPLSLRNEMGKASHSAVQIPQ